MEQSYASFFRALADFYEMHPNTPAPTLYSWSKEVHVYLDASEAKEYLQTIGSFEKKFEGETFYAIKMVNDGEVVIRFSTERTSVCRKVVKGTKIVLEHYVEGVVGHVEPERTEEIVEWECDEPILARVITPPKDIATYEDDWVPF